MYLSITIAILLQVSSIMIKKGWLWSLTSPHPGDSTFADILEASFYLWIMMSSLLVAALLFLTVPVNCSQNLSFLLLTSFSSEFNTSGVISAVDLALKDVLQDSNLLDHYTLQYTTAIDTKVQLNLFTFSWCTISILWYSAIMIIHWKYWDKNLLIQQ